jgi:hypothetical protein
MADRHQHRADHDGAALAERAVGKEAAEDRREINQSGIQSPDLRGQRLHIERTEYRLERAPDGEQSHHVGGVFGQKQIFRHIEHEQRAHPVIGEALPHLCGEQEGEALRMAEKFARKRLPGAAGYLDMFSQARTIGQSWPGIARRRRA